MENQNLNTNTLFETKEQYLKFRQSWAHYFNTEARKLRRTEYGNKIPKLSAEHFALYSLLRNRDPRKGFATKSSFEDAINAIKEMGAFKAEKLLQPFGGTITLTHLQRIQKDLLSTEKLCA